MQIRGKRSQSLPLQHGLRDSCPRSMINSRRNLLPQRNRDSSRIACSMDVRRVSGDSVKYCFADPRIDYMHLLEECRKAEDEDKVGQIKSIPSKAKVAAATVPPTREDELAKQLRYQQHQIDALVGQVKNLVSAVQSHKGLLQRGQYNRWARDANPILMERRFEGQRSA